MVEYFLPLLKIFSFSFPNKILFGIGSSDTLGKEAKNLGGRSAIFITDKNVIKTGLTDNLISNLEKESIKVHVFDRIEGEPTETLIEETCTAVRDGEYDLIVGLGGGSVLDISKIASVMVTNEGTFRDYIGFGLVKKPGLPKILIPTTAGTGSEVTRGSWFTLDGEKKGMISEHLVSDVAIVDPILTTSMPPRLTALTGFDALCQSIEPMMSTGASEITDALSIHALELISNNIRTACYQGQNLEARRAMSLGALMAGLAMNASLTYAHIFGGVLGPRYNLPHGLALITLPYIMEYNIPLCIDKLAKVAGAMGESISNLTLREAANRSILAVRRLMEDIGLPCSLKDLGVPSEDIPSLQDKFLELPALNPRKITKEDAPKLLDKMWKGIIC